MWTPNYLDPIVYQIVFSLLLVGFHKIVQALDADRLWQQIEALPND